MSCLRNAHVTLSNLGSRAPRVGKRGVENSVTVAYIIYSFGVIFYIFLQLEGKSEPLHFQYVSMEIHITK